MAPSNLGANFLATEEVMDTRGAPLISGSSLNLKPKEDVPIQAIIEAKKIHYLQKKSGRLFASALAATNTEATTL